MAEPHCDATSGTRRRGGATKRATAAPPCGACKFLRRKCISGCIFAPHFGSEHGAARFAAVHKVFGASNVSKILLHIPANRRHEAAVTITFEAQARLSDPVYGCVSTILALQQQVASLQAELATVQSQLRNSRLAFASAIRSTPPQLAAPPNMNPSVLQPAYSNDSSASTNLVNMSSCFDPPAMEAAHSFEPPHLSRLSQPDEDDELESKIPHLFNNGVLHP